MDVDIQVLHFTWECYAWGNWTRVVHDFSIHPVIFRSAAGNKIQGFTISSSSPGCAKRPTATGECSHDTIVVRGGYKSCLAVTRMSLEANLVFIYIWIACETIDHPADAPGPGHQGAGIFRLSIVSLVHQTDKVAGQISAAAIGLERCIGVTAASESGGCSKAKGRGGAAKRNDHGRFDAGLRCRHAAGDRYGPRVSHCVMAGGTD